MQQQVLVSHGEVVSEYVVEGAFGCGLFRTRGFKAHTWRALYVHVLKLHRQCEESPTSLCRVVPPGGLAFNARE